MSFSIYGTGSALGSVTKTNKDLEAFLDTSDQWIKSKTGIEERRLLGEGETLIDLAVLASKRAMEMAEITSDQLDLRIV